MINWIGVPIDVEVMELTDANYQSRALRDSHISRDARLESPNSKIKKKCCPKKIKNSLS